METKSFPLSEVKALENADVPGTFEALVAVFGNVDSGGDRIDKGAFTRTLAEKGLPPIVWSHEWGVPPIGVVESAAETDAGLQLKGRLFVGADEDHAVAKQVYAAMKAKDGNGQSPLREFSFGYSVRDSTEETVDGKTVRVLKDLELFEAGPTLVGMNPETRLIGVKTLENAVAASIAIDTKAGRVLSKANESKLRDAADALAEVLASVGDLQAEEDVAEETAPKNFDGTAVEKKDSPADKEPTKEPADAGDEESATRIAAVLLAEPIHIIRNQED